MSRAMLGARRAIWPERRAGQTGGMHLPCDAAIFWMRSAVLAVILALMNFTALLPSLSRRDEDPMIGSMPLPAAMLASLVLAFMLKAA